MASDLKAYLAAKYMSGPKADAILAKSGERRKKKRKVDEGAGGVGGGGGGGGAGFVLADDDAGWGKEVEREDEDDRPVEERRTAVFRPLGISKTSTVPTQEEEPEAEDERPQVVVEEDAPMVGGLVSSSQLQAQRERQKRAEKEARRLARQEAKEAELRGENETVYRDASGRKIDMKLVRAEEAKKERERLEKEMQRMEWGKGLVQREDKEKKKREEEEMRLKPMARYADDADLNTEQRNVERWNDPAALFLTKKEKKGPSRPQYQGPPPPPNRFGILPGYRWDGVDRSNGFERQLMQKGNDRKRLQAEAYAWSVDDM